MKILALGSDYFKKSLSKAGNSVVWAGPDSDCDIVVNWDRTTLSGIIDRLDQKPDVVLLTDHLSKHILPLGQTSCPVPMAYYGVDSPLNLFWQRHLAGCCDYAALDQRDEARLVSAEQDRPVDWLPVAIDPKPYEGQSEKCVRDIGFVGTVTPRVRPKRSNIIYRLRTRFEVLVSGERGQDWVEPSQAAQIYRTSRLSLNENLFPGVTTRILEVMASGGCLFTELTGNGLTDLFTDGKHFITFGPGDILDKAAYYLNRSDLRKEIASSGRKEVLANHTIAARAQTLLSSLESTATASKRLKPNRSTLAWTFLLNASRWPQASGKRRLAEARILFGQSLNNGQDEAETRYGLGLTLTLMERHQEAQDQFRLAVKSSVNNFSHQMALALSLMQTGLADDSQAVFAEAVQIAKDIHTELPDLDRADGLGTAAFHAFWGKALTASGHGITPGFNRSSLPMHMWGGFEHLLRSLELDPSQAPVSSAIAELLDAQHQHAFSVDFWEKAVELSPDNEESKVALEVAVKLAYLERFSK